MVQKQSLALSAIAFSFILNRFAFSYSSYSSYIITAFTAFIFELIANGIYSIVIYPKLLSPLRKLPQPKGGSFFMGQFSRIIKEPSGAPQRQWMLDVPNEGMIRYTHAFNSERVLLTSPKALAEVLVHKNYDFIKPWQIRSGLGRILGTGILLAEGDEHKWQRKILMPAFSFRHIKDLYPLFWQKAKEVTEAMTKETQKPVGRGGESSPILEVSNWASRVTLDIIGAAGLGKDFCAIQDPQNELIETYRKIFQPNPSTKITRLLSFFLPVWFLRVLPLRHNEEIINATRLIKETCRGLIRSKREKLAKSELTDADILSVAIESGGFSDDDLINQLMTFLAAGHETTASAMVWAVYLLCKHPEAQDRLREEIHTSLPSLINDQSSITASLIDHLPYLNAVCNEVLRFYPPVPLTLRITARDTSILSQPIPKGTTIIIPPWAVNTNKDLWGNDADIFNPDRWIGPGRANTGGADSNYSFLTFLHGPRSCIGKDFAKAEFACLLAAWVGRFKMSLENSGYELDIIGGITMKPRGGLKVNCEAVKGW